MRYTLAPMLLAATLVSAHSAEAQPAPDCGVFRIGWALPWAKDGVEGELFRELEGYSEQWIRFTPEQPALGREGAPQLLLVFSVCFKGKVMRSPQQTVELRVQVNGSFPSTPVPGPSLTLIFDGNTPYNLTGPKFQHFIESPNPCGPGCGSAVIVNLPVAVVQRIVGAISVTDDLSGIDFRMSAEQRAALGKFLQRVR